jgi:hypothetical protein
MFLETNIIQSPFNIEPETPVSLKELLVLRFE